MSCAPCSCPAKARVALTERTLDGGTVNAGTAGSRSFRNVVEVRLRRAMLPLQGTGAIPYALLRLTTPAGDDLLAPNAEGPWAYSSVVTLKKNYAADEVGLMNGCDQTLWRGPPRDFGGPDFWRWEARLPDGAAYTAAPGSSFLFELELTQAGPGCCAPH